MLTDEKKAKIQELRTDGYGYKAISILISETRDSVRSYCRKTGMVGNTATKNIRSIPQDDQDVYRKVKEATGGRYEYICGYVNADNKINIKCTSCGNAFSRYYRDVVFKKYDCPYCKNAITNLRKERQAIQKYRKKIEFYEKRLDDLIKDAVNRDSKKTTCVICGKEFIRGKRKKCCSKECSRKYDNTRRDRRIRKEIVVDEDINLHALFKRDRGVCYLCGKECDWNDYIIRDRTVICGDLYPSIDHVVPLSKGGKHSWANIKLAHRKCNCNKRDNIPPISLNFKK